MKVTNTESSKKISSLSFASIMSVFMVAGSLSITTPALKVIGNYFPDISATTIRLCSTLPGLLLVPTTLLSGWLVATRCRYKPIILFGAAAYIITGILPYFMNNFYAILIDRAMFGLALGILYPLGSALVLRLYRGAECERNIGRGTAVMSLALVLMQLGAGIVAAYSWRNVFLIHLIGAITFILILVACPEPEKIVRASKAEKARIPKDQREKFPARIVLIYLAFWLGNVMMSTVMINASYIVSGKGLGDSAVAGLLNSLVTFSGIFVGVLFGHIRKFTGNYTIGVGLIIGSLGMAIIFLAQNVFMLAAGALILGVGFILPQPALTMRSVF